MRRIRHVVTTIDLDLDVIRFRDGRLLLDDQDEFEEHKELYGYPEDFVEKAVATEDWLMEAVEQRREPFGSAGQPWLEMLA
ncbi:MAG: DUF402 domain-containing protein [Actinomycetota bacterium]